jgi:diguanylate cyclase (GGDEF)-like protein
MLLAISSKMALAIENALKYQQAESSATTDYLTGLPNARSLFLQLDRELARCKRDNSSLTVMVSDMDGFKQINDRFGHLEGNRVLRLFSHALKETCREYDYVARMGGDEFVVIAPGLTPEAALKKAEGLRELVKQVGKEVCNEDILSLSVGRSVYPDDGLDAEELLAEADRRMYVEKQNQPSRKNRRLYPRLKGRLTIELHPENEKVPILGNLTNISLGGCYVETSALLPPDSKLKLIFSMDDGKMQAEARVLRTDPGCGIAMKFPEGSRDDRANLQQILEFVDRTTKVYDNYYLSKMLKQ